MARGAYGSADRPQNSTKEEVAAYAERIRANPAEFIAQPTLALSTVPTLGPASVVERHADFRPSAW